MIGKDEGLMGWGKKGAGIAHEKIKVSAPSILSNPRTAARSANQRASKGPLGVSGGKRKKVGFGKNIGQS